MPEILDAREGVAYEVRVADDTEYRAALIEKLSEQIEDFLSEESIEELADIMEVIRALRRLPEYEDVKDVQRAKREEYGGFEERLIMSGEKY